MFNIGKGVEYQRDFELERLFRVYALYVQQVLYPLPINYILNKDSVTIWLKSCLTDKAK